MGQHRSEFSPAALTYFGSHAIAPALAAEVGVIERENAIVWPCQDVQGRPLPRARSLSDGGRKVAQAAGRSPAPWWPKGRPDRAAAVLITEGEADGLAAVCALQGAPEAVAGYEVVAMPGAASPARRLAGDLLACACRFAVI